MIFPNNSSYDGESGLIQNRTLQLKVPCLNKTNIILFKFTIWKPEKMLRNSEDLNIIFQMILTALFSLMHWFKASHQRLSEAHSTLKVNFMRPPLTILHKWTPTLSSCSVFFLHRTFPLGFTSWEMYSFWTNISLFFTLILLG